MDWIRLWITCTGMIIHSSWNAWKSSHIFAGAFTLPWTRPSNSSQMYLIARLGWNLGKELGKGLDVAGEELWCSLLHGVWWCRVETQRRGQPEVGWHVAAGFQQHISLTLCIQGVYSWTCSSRGDPTSPADVPELFQTIQEWVAIPAQAIHNLIQSMLWK